MHQRQDGRRAFRDGDVCVGQRDVADVFGQGADSVDHGQRQQGAVQLPLHRLVLLPLLAVGAVVVVALLLGGSGVAVDVAGGHLTEDGEEDGEAEVAAEGPPHATLKDGMWIENHGQPKDSTITFDPRTRCCILVCWNLTWWYLSSREWRESGR